MRGVLFKCARIQVRAATNEESMGAEIANEMLHSLKEKLNQVHKQRGFRDISGDGEPPQEDEVVDTEPPQQAPPHEGAEGGDEEVSRQSSQQPESEPRAPSSDQGSRRGIVAKAEEEAVGAPPRSKPRFDDMELDRLRLASSSASSSGRTAAGTVAPWPAPSGFTTPS
eukprot:4662497-Pyramimonas_sp.AAC.1